MENSRNIINKFVFPVFLVLLICGYVILLNISPINADYGYYVGAAKAIAHGLVPYRDISLGYSPFVFYLLSVPYAIGGENISPLIPMYISLFFYLVNGYLIWAILKCFEIKQAIRQLALILYIIYNISVESIFLGLEPFASFWGMLGTYVLLKDKKYSYWLTGICLTMAFLSKQYALLYAPIYAIMILLLKPELKIEEKLILILKIAFYSFLLVLVVHLFFVGVTGDWNYYTSLLGSNYGQQSFLGVIEVFKKEFFHFFFIVLLIPFVWWGIPKMGKCRIAFLVVAILLFMLQNYFEIYLHYLIFVVPYAVILFAVIIQYISNIRIKILICSITLFLGIHFLVKAVEGYQITKKDSENHCVLTRNQQLDIINFLKQIVPATSKTMLVLQENNKVTPYLYGVVDIIPINYQNTRFGFETLDQLFCQIEDAEVLIIEDSHPLCKEFVDKFGCPTRAYEYQGIHVLLK